jgi:serine/threonine-protein phosphatase 2A activator
MLLLLLLLLQFLPFVWGSGQLVGHPLIRPKSIHNEELLSMYGDEYMYLACVKFVKAVSAIDDCLMLC